ncbi:MAG: M48 family metallopeptidase [Beijerinckiaceae bacterium]
MFKAYGLYTQIRLNRLRSVLLLAGFVALLQALVYAFALFFASGGGGTVAQIMAVAGHDYLRFAPFAMAGAALWFFIAFLAHQQIIDYATGSTSVARKDAPKLYNALENLCISRGLPMPALKIIETDAMNAFASGVRDSNYSVSVTRGLMERLDDAELEAVLAHELTHIRNRDTQLLVIAIIFAGIFAFIGHLIFSNWNLPFFLSPRRSSSDDDSGERKSSSGAFIVIIIALVIIALSWGLSILIRFALSRTREYLADAGAVELTKNPDALISALRKIELNPQLPDVSARMSAFFIESPAASPEAGFLSTHPSMQSRIDALVRFGGGHDAPPPAQNIPAPSFLPPTPTGPWGITGGQSK